VTFKVVKPQKLEYLVLDEVLQWLAKNIPVNHEFIRRYQDDEPFEQPLLAELQQKYGLNIKQADRFFRAAYWYLMDHRILKVETRLSWDLDQGYCDYALSHPLAEEKVQELIPAILQRYGKGMEI
jgi:hypothetical protein